ncbi:MAG: transposase [Opitutaceae bacterium BACL24 MAG-120322-bin51]|nr:MAG: transposase [Opitutaceae bacterium BACL24 MAG-120322-bin51]
MKIKTLLNRVHQIKGFVYAKIKMIAGPEDPRIIAEVQPRRGSKPVCSGCGKRSAGYDHMPTPRQFEFIAMFNIPVFLEYTMRRVDCPDCGVKVERVPWADGKHTCCNVFRHFLATWAKRISWKETAECFHVKWDTVRRSVEWVVAYGLENRSLEGIEALGVDEVAYSKGHKYMTLVYQIDAKQKRLIGVLRERTKKTLKDFFTDELGANICAQVKVVCSDMWKPYLKIIAECLPNALNVLDRFHIVKKLGEAVDQVRREETKQLHADGYEPVLSNSRYCFLKRSENLSDKQDLKLNEVLQYDLKSVRAYYLKESFDAFWHYNSPQWASWYLKKWCTRAMRSRLEPMKKFVRTLRNHEELLMNYFKAGKGYSSGIVEGLNLKINLGIRKAYGYRSFDIMKVALLHQLGDLPEPEFTHRFC